MTLLNRHCADNHPSTSPVEMCVSFWDVMASAADQGDTFKGWTREDVIRKWTGYASEVRDRYVGRPNYLRIEGRPVLMHGYVHTMEFYQKFGIPPDGIVASIRSVIPNAYLIATCTAPEYYGELKRIGFDAFTEYLLHGKGWANTMDTYRWAWARGIETAKRTGLHYWVPCTSGYDGSAWDTPESREGFSHVPTPEQFTAHMKEAKKFSSDNRKWTLGRNIVYSLDEFGEQKTTLEPTVRNGDAYLRAFKEAA